MYDEMVCIQCGKAYVRLISEHPRIYSCRCGCYWMDLDGIMIPVKRLSVSAAKAKFKELDELFIHEINNSGVPKTSMGPYMEGLKRFRAGLLYGVMSETIMMFVLPDGSVNYAVNGEGSDVKNALG